ncbi:MAG TPA: hypothetical protein DDW65_08605 [Firmicutes bacterium]|nr:hypothetical protein [Bacillota bacterium]
MLGREAEISALLCRNYSANMIEARLMISRLTVYKHLENIYNKMKVNCRRDLRDKVRKEGTDESKIGMVL